MGLHHVQDMQSLTWYKVCQDKISLNMFLLVSGGGSKFSVGSPMSPAFTAQEIPLTTTLAAGVALQSLCMCNDPHNSCIFVSGIARTGFWEQTRGDLSLISGGEK